MGDTSEPGQLDVAIACIDLWGLTLRAEPMGDRESAEVVRLAGPVREGFGAARRPAIIAGVDGVLET